MTEPFAAHQPAPDAPVDYRQRREPASRRRGVPKGTTRGATPQPAHETPPDATVDFQAPMSDRQLFSIGLGYAKDDWTLDFAYTYLLADDRIIGPAPSMEIPETQTSNMDAHIFVISYSVRF